MFRTEIDLVAAIACLDSSASIAVEAIIISFYLVGVARFGACV